MATIDSPKIWIPYMNSKDCSQGFCSIYCPQWCNIIYPPPPFEFSDDDSGPSLSPLVIAIIGILASAFLLVSYYTIISKYCGNNNSARRTENHNQNEELEDNHNPSLHEPWQAVTTGLDEAFIKSITTCKYRKGDGLIEVTDCSVCLSEFEEDESIRLLPKCSHAFHVPCIDTWLKSHSNCPLCRANIVFVGASLPQLASPVLAESPQSDEPLQDGQQANDNAIVAQEAERELAEEETVQNDRTTKTPLRVYSDLGNLEQRDTIIEIRDDGCQHLRRSISMDHSCQNHTSVADILRLNQDQIIHVEEESCSDVGSSKYAAEVSKSSYRRRVFHCVLSPVSMKRSLSSGRFSFNRH